MQSLESLGAGDLVGLVDKAIEALRVHKEEINAMNVFPVPDGDTGTNMLLTMQAVRDAVRSANHHDMKGLCQAISRGSLMGARGNSGVVLSQILKGMTEVLGENDLVDVEVFSRALSRGSEVAYRAVMKPVEGTILTVVREAAEEGEKLRGSGVSLQEWLAGVVIKARETLEHTPDLLPVLKDAGVVDAGGRGLLAIFEGMLAYLSGEELEAVEEEVAQAVLPGSAEGEDYRYEAQFMLHCKDSRAKRFREVLHTLGGSVLVVGGDRLYRVHVHTDELGKVIEEASAAGRLTDVEITDLKLQVEEAGTARSAAREKPIGVVAVAVGEGIKEILRSMGVDLIVDGGQSMNPSTAEMLDAIDSLPQDKVLLIPNNKNIIPAAEQARELTSKEVAVIPAVSITEGFAAMVAYDPRSDLADNRDRMGEALGSVKTGAVTAAVRDSKVKKRKIRKGEFIGLFRGEIVSASHDALQAATELLERMVEKGDEIVSVIIGEEARGLDHGPIVDLLEGRGLEVEVIDGGQPVYHYIFGVE
ncbi:MAG: DAK2 domain-containing protein [Actinobacteria bacterium]|nr:DAK2 domain-containing protein [Actinomycetota bacterium]MDI6831303.1 DAK2 domain-containing protein [Actinomycetota bacterium]